MVTLLRLSCLLAALVGATCRLSAQVVDTPAGDKSPAQAQPNLGDVAAVEAAIDALAAGERGRAESALFAGSASPRARASGLAATFALGRGQWNATEQAEARRTVLRAFTEAAETVAPAARQHALLDGAEFAWNVLRDARETEAWVTAAGKIDPENPRFQHLRAQLEAKQTHDRRHVADAAAMRAVRESVGEAKSPLGPPVIPRPDTPPPVGGATPVPPTLPVLSSN